MPLLTPNGAGGDMGEQHGDTGVPVRRHGDVLVISPAGELDIETAPGLSRAIATWPDSGTTRLVVDLSAVTFIDSMGVGSLVKAVLACRERGSRLTLVGAGPQVHRVLQMTQVDTLTDQHERLEDAVGPG